MALKILSALLFIVGHYGAPLALAKDPSRKDLTPQLTSASPSPKSPIPVNPKTLAKPDNTKNLRWQRIAVGQEKIDGAEIFDLPKSSALRRMGLRQGDVIVRINGEKVPDATSFKRALMLKDQGTLDLEVLRDQQRVQLQYKINW
ncbi:MAG: PDZ domain-containing protein [Oligoflexia bacterium]|nr:PDZ domain-containing protein [Oligoflexia bacterium]